MSSLHTSRKTPLSSVDTASGHAGWTASSSTGLRQLGNLFTMFSYLLSSLPHFLCLSSAHAFGCRVCLQCTRTAPHGGLYLQSQQSNTHSPTNPTICTILKRTRNIPRQRPEVWFTQSALSLQGKGWQHHKPPAQELEFGHSRAEFWSPAIPRLKTSDLGRAFTSHRVWQM